MNKLMINDIFIVNITTFTEIIDASGLLRLTINEQLAEDVNLNELEMLLISLRPYFEDDSIFSVKVLDENDNILLDTCIFTKLQIASLSVDNIEHMTLDISFV